MRSECKEKERKITPNSSGKSLLCLEVGSMFVWFREESTVNIANKELTTNIGPLTTACVLCNMAHLYFLPHNYLYERGHYYCIKANDKNLSMIMEQNTRT